MLIAAFSFLFLTAATDPLVERLLSFPAFPPASSARAEVASASAEKLTGAETIDVLSTLALTRSKLITPAVRREVMQRLASEPDILPQAIELLPETAEAVEAAWAAFGKTAVAQRNGDGYERVREWLRHHGYLRNELMAAVKNVHDDDGF